jgi:hypothetical protein
MEITVSVMAGDECARLWDDGRWERMEICYEEAMYDSVPELKVQFQCLAGIRFNGTIGKKSVGDVGGAARAIRRG